MKLLSLCLPMLLISCQPCMAQEIDVLRLKEAIYRAEGGIKSKSPYGILSVPCKGKGHCGKICENTIRNNLRRWHRTGRKVPFLTFLAGKYAPVGSDTDNGTNRHWLGNVRAIYDKLGRVA